MSKMGHNIYGTSRNFGSMHLLMPPELVWMTVGTEQNLEELGALQLQSTPLTTEA